jgi:hypothetical protein
MGGNIRIWTLSADTLMASVFYHNTIPNKLGINDIYINQRDNDLYSLGYDGIINKFSYNQNSLVHVSEITIETSVNS